MSRTFERIVAVMGSPAVGKSALTGRLTENRFQDDYIPTIARRLKINMSHNGVKYDVTIIDTAGLDPQSTIPSTYVREAHGYILVYSINDRHSFDTVKNIHEKLVEEKFLSNIPLVLVGNKTDLNSERCVSNDEAQRFAQQIGAKFIETSAKLGDNVQQLLPFCLDAIDFNNNSNQGGDSSSSKGRSNNNNNNSSNNKDKSNCSIS